MNPATPTPPVAPGWQALTFAKNQPQYLALPTLVGNDPGGHAGMPDVSDTITTPVVSVWQPTDEEMELLSAMVADWRHDQWWLRTGKNLPGIARLPEERRRPTFSLMVLTFGNPLQPIKLTVGEFPEPYAAE